MGVILVNCVFDTLRPLPDPNYADYGALGLPQPYLCDQDGHYQPMYARHYQLVPSSAVKSTHLMITDPEVDIQKGDQVVNILLPDGMTPWPHDEADESFVWNVTYVRVSGWGALDNRIVYLERYEIGGPSHP